jgi:hypothetical protein
MNWTIIAIILSLFMFILFVYALVRLFLFKTKIRSLEKTVETLSDNVGIKRKD